MSAPSDSQPTVSAGNGSRSTRRGLVAGLITAAVALGVAQLVAGILQPQGSPVAAVGSVAIDNTPPQVKNFAIATFGSHDKLALVIGILVLLAIFSGLIGILAMRRLAYGYAGLAVFALVGLTAALAQPHASAGYALPTLVGAAAAAFALAKLVRAATVVPRRVAAAPRAARPPRLDIPGFEVPDDPALASSPGAGNADDDRAAGEAGDDMGPDDAGDAGTGEEAGAAGGDRWNWVPSGEPEQARAADPGRDPVSPAPGGSWAGPPRVMQPPSGPGRRSFLTVSGVAVAAAGVSALAGRALAERTDVTQARAAVRLPRPAHPAPALPPGTDLDIPGLSPFITPNGPFYRVDTALILPQVSPQSWQLHIHGMVEREITISFKDLLRRPLIEDYVTLTCVSNPVAGLYIGNARWLGASLASLLRTARVRAGADQLLCTSTDGFTSGTPIATVLDGRDALLAVAMNGTPLPVAHGFPVRMVTPGLYGYVSATKWVTDIKVTTFSAEVAYWAQRGWSQQAPIKTESRIDVPNSAVKAGRTPVAGVAWAQHKGIDAVHVRVDGGAWHQATLAAVPGIDTWRQWVWEWDATPGTHIIEARATDATGYTQTAQQAPPEPNGASGYPSVTLAVH